MKQTTNVPSSVIIHWIFCITTQSNKCMHYGDLGNIIPDKNRAVSTQPTTNQIKPSKFKKWNEIFGLELPFYMFLTGKLCGPLDNCMAQAKWCPPTNHHFISHNSQPPFPSSLEQNGFWVAIFFFNFTSQPTPTPSGFTKTDSNIITLFLQANITTSKPTHEWMSMTNWHITLWHHQEQTERVANATLHHLKRAKNTTPRAKNTSSTQ